MIRPTTPGDSPALIALAVEAGMFPAGETGALGKVLTDYFEGNLGDGHVWVTDDGGGGPRGVAYYSSAQMTDGTWYLKMIAVRPNSQRQGFGAALLRHVEDALRAAGQRVLLVETSGLPNYARTRAFYAKCGYEEEARVRDYYTAGDDMIIFRKALNAN